MSNDQTSELVATELTLRELAIKMGIKDIKPYWNDEWLARVTSLPEGPTKEAEKTRALNALLDSLIALQNGDYDLVELAGDTKDPLTGRY